MQFARFIESENTTVNAAYFAALAADADLGRTRGIDGTLKKFNLDAILLPTDGAYKQVLLLLLLSLMMCVIRLHLGPRCHRRLSYRCVP